MHAKHLIWRDRITLPETCILSFFFSYFLFFFSMQNTLYKKTKRYNEKHVLWVFLSFIGTKTLESITRLPKTCILRIFHIVKYQNTIIHVKHSKWGKETTFPETCNSIVYEHVCHQYAKKKKNRKHVIWENKRTLRKRCLLGAFELLTY